MVAGDDSGPAEIFHDAFISYSRKDMAFASTLERALRRYYPPGDLKAPQRRLNVFRDAEDLTGTEYHSSIERNLRWSRKLIVICSPNARGSGFVNDEIRRYAQFHEAKDIIPVLIAGIPNNEVGPGTEAELAFPDALLEQLELPLANDYRGFNPASDNPEKGRFRQAWFKLLADIYERTRAEVEQREQRRLFRLRLQWGAAGLALSVAMGALAYYGFERNREAMDKTVTAKSDELASQSLQLAENDPEHALSLAREAVDRRATALSASALRVALANSPDALVALVVPTPAGDDNYQPPTAIAFAPGGRSLAIADDAPRIVDAQTGVATLPLEKPRKHIRQLQFSPDGALIAAIDDANETAVIDAKTGRIAARLKGELHWRASPAVGARRAVALLDKAVQLDEFDAGLNFRVTRSISPRDYKGPKHFSEDPTHELSPDSSRIAMLVEDGAGARVTVADLDSGQASTRSLQKPGGLSKLSWSPKGTYIAAASLFGLHVIDARTLKTVFKIDTGNEITVEDISFSTDEKLLASTDRSGVTTLWSVSNGKKAGQFVGPGQRSYDPVFSPAGDLLSVRYADDSVALFRVEMGLHEFKNGLGAEPAARFAPFWKGAKSAKFSPDGARFVVEHEGSRLAIWRSERWLPERRISLRYEPRWEAGVPLGLKDVVLKADGSAVGMRSGGDWRAWSVTTGLPADQPAVGLKSLKDVTLSEHDGLRLQTDKRDETVVYVLNSGAGGEKLSLKHNAQVMSRTFSSEGSCILTASRFFAAGGGAPERADVARLWDAETGRLLSEWVFGYGEPHGAVFATPDRIIVLSDGDAYVFGTPFCADVAALRRLSQESAKQQTPATDQ